MLIQITDGVAVDPHKVEAVTVVRKLKDGYRIRIQLTNSSIHFDLDDDSRESAAIKAQDIAKTIASQTYGGYK